MHGYFGRYQINTNPWPPESAFADNIETAVGGPDVAIRNVDAILVLERGICPFPSGDSAATASQANVAGLNPRCTEAIEKVGLTGNRRFVEISASQFANVNLRSGYISAILILKTHDIALSNEAHLPSYRILITQELTLVKPCIGISHAQRQARTIRVWHKVVDKV